MSKRPSADAPHTTAEKVLNESLTMGVSCSEHPLALVRPLLEKHGIVTARDLRRIPSNTRVRVTGLRVLVHMPPTKSGKRVIFITLEDETGLLDLVAFPKAQQRSARAILTSQVLTVEGKLQHLGKNGLSTSIVVGKVIHDLSGDLVTFLRPSPPPANGIAEPKSHVLTRPKMV